VVGGEVAEVAEVLSLLLLLLRSWAEDMAELVFCCWSISKMSEVCSGDKDWNGTL